MERHVGAVLPQLTVGVRHKIRVGEFPRYRAGMVFLRAIPSCLVFVQRRVLANKLWDFVRHVSWSVDNAHVVWLFCRRVYVEWKIFWLWFSL